MVAEGVIECNEEWCEEKKNKRQKHMWCTRFGFSFLYVSPQEQLMTLASGLSSFQ